jgi:hypothetical protein
VCEREKEREERGREGARKGGEREVKCVSVKK